MIKFDTQINNLKFYYINPSAQFINEETRTVTAEVIVYYLRDEQNCTLDIDKNAKDKKLNIKD